MKQTSLLEGNIPRELTALAAPLLVGNVLQQLYNTADSLIVGQLLGLDAFSSTGVSGTVMNLFIFILTGFCSGLTVLFGQDYGMEDLKGFRKTMFTALTVGSGLTICLSLLCIPLLRPLLHAINTPDELMAYCMSYLQIILAGLLCTYFYNLFSAILQSVGDTRAGLCFLFLSVCVNVVLDYALIAWAGMGIQGAAVATVAAQFLSAGCCFLYLCKRYPQLLCRREDAHLSPALLSATMRFGLTSALHQSTLYIGKLLVQGAVNTLGTPGIAAYTAATRIEGFANSFGDSGAQSMSIFTAQNTGANDKARIREGLRKGLVMMSGLGIFLSIVMFAIAPAGVQAFLSGEGSTALTYGTQYLRTIAIFYILCFIGSTFVGYYRGKGRVFVPFTGTCIQLTFRVVLSYLLVRTMGLQAIALATGIGWISVVTYQVILFFHQKRQASKPGALETS